MSFEIESKSKSKLAKDRRGQNTLAFYHKQVACSHLVAISGSNVTWVATFSRTVRSHSWEHPAATAHCNFTSELKNKWSPLKAKGS